MIKKLDLIVLVLLCTITISCESKVKNGEELYNTGNIEEATTVFSQVEESDDEYPAAQLWLYKISLAKGDSAVAANHIKNAYNAAQSNPMDIDSKKDKYENWSEKSGLTAIEKVNKQKEWLGNEAYLQAIDVYSYYLFSGELSPYIKTDIKQAIEIQENTGFYYNDLAAGIMRYYTEDYDKAYNLISQYIDGNGVANGYLGLMYKYGFGRKEDKSDCYLCLEAAAKSQIAPFVIHMGDLSLSTYYKWHTGLTYSPQNADAMLEYIGRAVHYYELATQLYPNDEYTKIRYNITKSIIDAKNNPENQKYNYNKDKDKIHWNGFTNHPANFTVSYSGEVLKTGPWDRDLMSQGYGILFQIERSQWGLGGSYQFWLGKYEKGYTTGDVIYKNSEYLFVGNGPSGKGQYRNNNGNVYNSITNESYNGGLSHSEHSYCLAKVFELI